MQQFKFDPEDLSGQLGGYSSEELSLLNSRRRPLQHSQRGSETERQNQEEIKEFRREIQERFKVSIANKIYTFPRIINSIADIISSDEEYQTVQTHNKSKDIIDMRFAKSKSNRNKNTDSIKPFQNAKKGKDKMKTNDSTGKRFMEDQREIARGKMELSINPKKSKKKIERLKTEQGSNSFMQTIRSKAQKKN